jgi:hypothetical protein
MKTPTNQKRSRRLGILNTDIILNYQLPRTHTYSSIPSEREREREREREAEPGKMWRSVGAEKRRSRRCLGYSTREEGGGCSVKWKSYSDKKEK